MPPRAMCSMDLPAARSSSIRKPPMARRCTFCRRRWRADQPGSLLSRRFGSANEQTAIAVNASSRDLVLAHRWRVGAARREQCSQAPILRNVKSPTAEPFASAGFSGRDKTHGGLSAWLKNLIALSAFTSRSSDVEHRHSVGTPQHRSVPSRDRDTCNRTHLE